MHLTPSIPRLTSRLGLLILAFSYTVQAFIKADLKFQIGSIHKSPYRHGRIPHKGIGYTQQKYHTQPEDPSNKEYSHGQGQSYSGVEGHRGSSVGPAGKSIKRPYAGMQFYMVDMEGHKKFPYHHSNTYKNAPIKNEYPEGVKEQTSEDDKDKYNQEQWMKYTSIQNQQKETPNKEHSPSGQHNNNNNGHIIILEKSPMMASPIHEYEGLPYLFSNMKEFKILESLPKINNNNYENHNFKSLKQQSHQAINNHGNHPQFQEYQSRKPEQQQPQSQVSENPSGLNRKIPKYINPKDAIQNYVNSLKVIPQNEIDGNYPYLEDANRPTGSIKVIDTSSTAIYTNNGNGNAQPFSTIFGSNNYVQNNEGKQNAPTEYDGMYYGSGQNYNTNNYEQQSYNPGHYHQSSHQQMQMYGSTINPVATIPNNVPVKITQSTYLPNKVLLIDRNSQGTLNNEYINGKVYSKDGQFLGNLKLTQTTGI